MRSEDRLPESAVVEHPPAAADRPRPGPWQFSLLSLLVTILVGCLLAGYTRERWAHMAEYQRRIDISRGLDRQRERMRELDRLVELEREKEKAAAKVLTVADRTRVYVKSVQSPVGSRDLGGWAWTIYLPPDRRDWWLYISHGTKWDASEGKYVDGAVSGAQLKATGEQTIYGCIVRDQEGGGYINMWSVDGCQTARLPDAGHAAFSAGADEVREVTGEAEQEVLSPDTSPHGRMPLLRWHRVRSEDGTTIPIDAVGEYGFSIFLVDKSPVVRPRPPRPIPE